MSARTTQLKKIDPEEVTVAIFVALVEESVAVVLSFDEEFRCGTRNKKYIYRFGCIGKHYVVIAQPNEMGTVNASNVAAYVTNEFQNVRLALMVGIGGGIPSDKKDIRLGDIAVSKPESNLPGVLQYDFVKVEGDRKVVLKGSLDKPHATLLSAVNYVEGEEIMDRSQLPEILTSIINKNSKFKHPEKADVLYDPIFRHVEEGKDCTACEKSSAKKIVERLGKREGPKVHRGLILSGDSVVKDPSERLRLCRGYEQALCFEMEAAGVMDETHCLVIRGICDYCDTHKQDGWHYYAAAVAAAYARTILLTIPSEEVEQLEQMSKTLKIAEEQLRTEKEHRDISQERLEWQKYNDILPIQYDALHDSDAVSQQAPLCHQGTRKGILNEITEWAEDVKSETIFWLHGPAGTGKSTISRTIADQLATDPTMTARLGASYFFKTPSSKRFFPTVAARLVHSIPQLKKHFWKSLEYCGWLNKAEIEGKDRKQQFETLILNPIKALSKQCSDKWTRVIIIDALDECEREHIRTICTQLSRLHRLDAVRLRVFLTSRPTSTIVDIFESLEIKHITRSLSLLIFSDETKGDIETVLKANFAVIKKRRKIPGDWPGHHDLDHLLNLATTPSPLFIYAATVCRYVDNGMTLTNPVRRLKYWLEHVKNASKLDEQLNHMYETVLDEALSSLHSDERELLKEILRSVVLLAIPLPVRCLAALLDVTDLDVECLLPNLHAVFDVQPDSPVKIVHESFKDFLLDPEGTGTGTDSFRVDALETHEMLVLKCIKRMKRKGDGPLHGLQRDMCDHGDYGKSRDEISHIISKDIPLDLKYACLNWVHHLQSFQRCKEQIKDEDRNEVSLQKISALLQEVDTFLEKHFFHWIETLALLGRLSEGVSSIRQLRHISQSISDLGSDFAVFLKDAERFVVSYGSIIERAPLQIYGAALEFCPTDTTVYKRLRVERYSDIPTLKGIRRGWDQCLHTLKGHGGSVNAIAFSSSCKVLASASSDRTVRLWDGTTGAHKRTLQGHGSYVLAVAFSPDSKMLASASSDRTVWLWDVDEGTHIRTLAGHGDWVNSVAFLSNGILASASSDRTVRLWDIHKGIHTWILKGHDGSVNAVAFSPDGKVLASVSGDQTVRLWNIEKQTHIKTSQDHNSSVNAVAFSPDGAVLASASSDWTVRLWDADKGTYIRTLEGHKGWVNSVAFLSNSILVSASSDRTVQLRNLTTDKIQKLEEPGGWVNAIVVLPDRNVLASASSDQTVRIWDADIGASDQIRKGHDGSVNAVAFSPNGKWLASASSDGTVWLWNVDEGTHVKTFIYQNPYTGDKQVPVIPGCDILAIAFSPDGRILASASKDLTIWLWYVDEGTYMKTLKNQNHTTGNKQTLEDHDRYVLAIAFSPDGKMLASASSDWRVRLWDVRKGTVITTLEGHRNWVRAIAFSPDGKLLASASTDGTLWLWDVDKDDKKMSKNYDDLASSILRERYSDVAKSTHKQSWVRAVAFSPDGTVLAAASTDGTVSYLNIDKGNHKRTLDSLAVAFSLDGTVLETIRRLKPPILEKPDKPENKSSRTLPPSRNDPTAMWEYIQAAISIIMDNLQDGLDMKTYINVYSAVHDICMTPKVVRSHLASTDNSCEDLYMKLQVYLTKHLEQLLDKSMAYTGGALLAFYTREWSRYNTAAKYINHLFRHLNRWIKNNTDKRRKDIYDIYILHLDQWRSVIIGSISGKIMDVVLKLIEKERNGEIIENGRIKQVVESFVSLCIDEYGSDETTLDRYRYNFEQPFLEATEQFYRVESKQLLAEHGVVEYMKRAEIRLNREDELVRNCLHPDTMNPLRRACDQALIAEHSDILRDEFQRLLDEGREEDMARTVNLLARTPDGLTPLLSKFEAYLRKAGLAAVTKAASTTAKLEPKIYVGPVPTQYQGLAKWTLSGHLQSTGSSDNACRELISQNDVCKSGSDKFPKLPSKYTDSAGVEDVTYAISISEDWITQDGRNLVCLPPDYRATCAALWNNVLALGHRSGQVSFFQFP